MTYSLLCTENSIMIALIVFKRISIVFKPSVYICNNVCLDVSNSAFKDNVVCNPK